MKNKWSILFAILALVLATLACSVGDTELSMTNTRTALDEDGVNVTTTFGPLDTVYIVSDIANGTTSNVVGSKWYVVNVEGVEPNLFLDEAEITLTEDPFNGTVYFFFPPPNGEWPVGSYKVESYLDGALISTNTFSVQ